MPEETQFNLKWAGRLLKDTADKVKSFPMHTGNAAGFHMKKKTGSMGEWEHVESLKLRFSRGSYNNEFIDQDTLAYVYSPQENVNTFVEKKLMGVKEKPVRVHIISLDYKDYDAGLWYFHSSDKLGTNSDGTMVNAQRFILQRLHRLEQETAPEVEEETPPPKRPRVEEEGADRRLYYNDHKYDSLLEVRHAHFLDSLGLAFQPHPCTAEITCIDSSGALKETSYAPDLCIRPFQVRHGGSMGALYVEIKPCLPHMGEMSKVEAFSKQYGCNVLLLYGDFKGGNNGLPFSREDWALNSDTGRHYLHSNGIRGMLFCGKEEDFRRVEGVVWNINKDGDILIDALLHSGDTRWEHERLVAAYAEAAKVH